MSSASRHGEKTNTNRDSVAVFAPATVANVASGFDVLGFALERPEIQW